MKTDVFLVNAALISRNTNVQQDTEMSLKLEHVKVLQTRCRTGQRAAGGIRRYVLDKTDIMFRNS